MPQHLPGNMEGTVDKRRATAGSAAVTTGSVATPANYNSNSALDAALIAAGYTQARCDQMTQNDKIYALRLTSDAAGVG
jgi:hypothetical protein